MLGENMVKRWEQTGDPKTTGTFWRLLQSGGDMGAWTQRQARQQGSQRSRACRGSGCIIDLFLQSVNGLHSRAISSHSCTMFWLESI